MVSQPSKTDPTQVLVSWEKIIQRPECVDKYTVHVWPENTDVKLANKVMVQEKKGKNVATSATVIVDPCINYKYFDIMIFRFNNCLCRFMVELEEVDSVTGVNKEKTGEQVFKTVAKPTVASSLDKSNFKVSYHWNKIKQHIDLTKADIVLDTSLITYPSCLDSIQVWKCFVYLLYFPLVGF